VPQAEHARVQGLGLRDVVDDRIRVAAAAARARAELSGGVAGSLAEGLPRRLGQCR